MQADAAQLFDRATTGDPEALEALLERYLPQLHAFVHARLGPRLRARESTVDVVQSVCRQLLANRSLFDFRGEERFRAWLFRSALNKLREKHRRLKAERRSPGREERWHEDLAPRELAVLAAPHTPSEVAVGRETAAAVAAALDALSEEHREVITLARLVELPHRVIAELMDRSEDAVRQLLGRALLRLARELAARGIDVTRAPAGGG